MAEIKIEKKKPMWPWILLVLIILGIIAYLVYDNQDKIDLNDDFDDGITNEQVLDSQTSPQDHSQTTDYSSNTYNQYAAFEGSISDSTRIAVDSSYTKKAYYNLTKAVVNVADENSVEDSKELKDLREFSMLITKVSSPLGKKEDAKNFKTAGDKVVKVLEDIQSKNFPGLQSEVSDLKQINEKIDGYVNMNSQQTSIYEFLRKSRDILRTMNE